ncbi:MAG: hypothetical protein AAGE84_20480 [Cyanobacteria bacterium P01_G01_bin.39]
MEVKNVHQNIKGEWHIDYGVGHLMGLALRVCIGQALLSLFIGIPLSILMSLASANSLNESKNIDLNSNSNSTVLQKSVCNQKSN